MNWKFWEVIVEKTVYIEKKRKPSIAIPPTDEEKVSWRSRKAGKYFIAGLYDELEEIKDNIVSGLYTAESSDGTAQQMGMALGKCQQLEDVIETLESFGQPDEEEE